MMKNVFLDYYLFLTFLKVGFSSFSPFLLVSGGSGPARKLGETGRKISSEYRQDRTTGVREMKKHVFNKHVFWTS